MTGEAPHDRPVLATYLHLEDRHQFRPFLLDDPAVSVMECSRTSAAFYRFLYASVGSGFSWVDRLTWSDAALAEYLARPEVTILVMSVEGETAGYAELLAGSDARGTELKYFGIFPEFHGRGLGKHLLSVAVQRAFDDGAERVWLSTRSTDGPHAIANYEARGFTAYKREWEPNPVLPDDAHVHQQGPA